MVSNGYEIDTSDLQIKTLEISKLSKKHFYRATECTNYTITI